MLPFSPGVIASARRLVRHSVSIQIPLDYIANYDFEGAGDQILDTTGNGYHSASSNQINKISPTPYGAKSGHITRDLSSWKLPVMPEIIASNQISVSCKFRSHSGYSNASGTLAPTFITLVGYDPIDDENKEINIGRDTNGYFEVEVYSPSTHAAPITLNGPRLNVGRFVTVVLTINFSGNVAVYFDGDLADSDVMPANANIASWRLTIGSESGNYTADPGTIDKLRIFDRIVDGDEIAALTLEDEFDGTNYEIFNPDTIMHLDGSVDQFNRAIDVNYVTSPQSVALTHVLGGPTGEYLRLATETGSISARFVMDALNDSDSFSISFLFRFEDGDPAANRMVLSLEKSVDDIAVYTNPAGALCVEIENSPDIALSSANGLHDNAWHSAAINISKVVGGSIRVGVDGVWGPEITTTVASPSFVFFEVQGSGVYPRQRMSITDLYLQRGARTQADLDELHLKITG